MFSKQNALAMEIYTTYGSLIECAWELRYGVRSTLEDDPLDLGKRVVRIVIGRMRQLTQPDSLGICSHDQAP